MKGSRWPGHLAYRLDQELKNAKLIDKPVSKNVSSMEDLRTILDTFKAYFMGVDWDNDKEGLLLPQDPHTNATAETRLGVKEEKPPQRAETVGDGGRSITRLGDASRIPHNRAGETSPTERDANRIPHDRAGETGPTDRETNGGTSIHTISRSTTAARYTEGEMLG